MIEYELQADGYALGFPGDTQLMRARYRTPAGLSRECDALDGEPNSDRCKPVLRAYTAQGSPPLTEYRTFVKKNSKGSK